MADSMALAPQKTLNVFMTDLFCKAGLTADDAAFHSEALIQANLWGVDSHGVLRAPIYIDRIRSGAVTARPDIRKVRGGLAFELWDGDDGPGYIVARDTMRRAIALAETYGIGAVGVTRSNHFGAAGLYARMATDQNMIGVCMTNVTPNMAAPGGAAAITGNNPIAFSIPTFQAFPLTLDMSLSNVAGGKLLLASKEGRRIPLDWATDPDGQPTDDPALAFKGFLLPVGGYKGLGLSYVVDILSGLITGGAFQHGMKGMYRHPDEPSLTGHFMIVINPLDIIDLDDLCTRMTDFYQTIKASPMADSGGEMLLPGELEYRTEQERLANGIPLPESLLADLVALGDALGVDAAPLSRLTLTAQ